MEHARIVIANDPRAYRDVIGATVRVMRPDLDVVTVAPEELEPTLLARPPGLVVCSRLTAAVESNARSWIVLYPDGRPGATLNVAGEHAALAEIDLPHLLAAIDRAAQ